MKKIIIGAALAVYSLSAYDDNVSRTIDYNAFKQMIRSEALKEAIEIKQFQYVSSLSAKYFEDNKKILNAVDQNFKCKSMIEINYIIQSGINSNRGNYMKLNIDKIEEIDLVKNFSLNAVYVPFCSDMINKSVGSFSFSKKNMTGLGINISNANFCGNYYKYINHLSSENNDLKNSFAVLVSRFSSLSLKKYSDENDITIQAKALLHYLDYGKTGFDPVGFAEIYFKNNQSTKPKIGGKDEEFETFILSIFSGSFKTADNILESNIENSKKVLELIENSENCDFN